MSEDAFKHTWYEDLFGIATGSILLAIGIHMLKEGHILTGGTVGLALLLTKTFHISMSVIYDLISIPFFILGIWKKGWRFATRSFINILVVSYLVSVMPRYIHMDHINPLVIAVVANTILGMGLLAIFRHNSSLGGFNITALIAQDLFKIQAGYIQAALDICVLAAGLIYYDVKATLCSLIGVVVLNGILALYHRQDRYVGHS